MTTQTDCLERLEEVAVDYRERLANTALVRDELYDLIAEAAELLSVREIARATRLSPGRVHQIQHGR